MTSPRTAPSTNGPVRYAVVGLGQISQQAFLPAIARTGNSVLAALVTGTPEKARELAAEYGVPAYSYEDYPALLASGDVDAVYVATPVFRHREFAEPALEAGIHVLVEKPMETSVADCRAMIDAAARGGARLMVAYRLHHEPGTLELITRVRDEALVGEPRLFTAVFAQDIDEANHRGHSGFWGGPIPDMGSYPLNAVRNLFAAEPVEVHAMGVRTPGRGFDFDDTVAVTLRFPGERLAQFTISYATEATEQFTVVGTGGALAAQPCFGFGPEVGISYTVTRDGRTETRTHDPVEQFAGQTDYFSACILTGAAPEADGEEGLLDIRVHEAVLASLETGLPVRLEPADRAVRPSADQVRTLPPVAEPDDDELVAQLPQNG
ncbi:Gfo/Idh/MocA family protein [Kocuria turfanensis]|uniref:Glucose-fructose oxidoreductase n=1 Tax=Kocuria turfanensis TaxID=388357 RepID=A0A512IGN4_9MICC|nr:Gfo/Idh/MocA family oxidoreductase [Kocuria turfanensis]GEO96827.1 glucose-fructose oxidoreductase [Kocuria turfanensis]